MTRTQASILIVDDEEAISWLLRQKLSHEGYYCLDAGDGDQALDKLKENRVSLVILDIKMPGKSGMELLPEIRSLYPDTAVIMATANNDINIAIQCLKQGASDYVTKPFNLDAVAMGVSRALEIRRLQLENRDYQQHLEQRVEEQSRRIRASFFNAIAALAYALEAKDKYTSGHSQRVSELSVGIARALGLASAETEKIGLAGLIHDIGKIGVREEILNKPGKLTEAEFQQVKGHSEIGERILVPVTEDGTILSIVRHHHERYDGAGYPDRLAGEQIPLGARILAVADTFDAMMSERPYRRALDAPAAYREIQDNSGTQLDPVVAETFMRLRKAVPQE
ncbi:MAG: response regulator [Chloroflexi bacterium]|nr:response regulator [Chloroflexota bacterium]